MSKDKATFTSDDPQAAEQIAEKRAAEAGTLPDAGPERAEYLRRKAAEMVNEANRIETALDLNCAVGDVPIDREVRQSLNAESDVVVSKPQPGYRYCWVYRDPQNTTGGVQVRKHQALKYEIVKGDMPEAREHRQVTGERWVADCLLMRIKNEDYVEQQMRERARRLAMQEACEAPLRNVADRYGVRVLDMGELADVGPFSKDAARGKYYRMNATGAIDRQLKSGTLPGAPQPGHSA